MHLSGWYLRCLVLVQCAGQFHCIKVVFRSNRTLKVARNQTLVLEASVSEGGVKDANWDIKRADGRFRIFPQVSTPEDPRISGKWQGNELKLTVKNVRKDDFGKYIVMVTDEAGHDSTTEKTVEESAYHTAHIKAEKIARTLPNLQLSYRLCIATLYRWLRQTNSLFCEINAVSLLTADSDCEVAPDYEQWDTPKFEWLVDGNKVLNTSDKLSPDGRSMKILDASGRNYTCRVSSSLGTRDTHYSTGCEQNSSEPMKPTCNSCTVPWVVMSFVSLGCLVLGILGTLGILHCRKKGKNAPETPSSGSPTELGKLRSTAHLKRNSAERKRRMKNYPV